MRIFLSLLLLFQLPAWGQEKFMVNCQWNSGEAEDPGVDYVEQMPSFPGGEDSLNQFIEDHLYVPKDENKQSITGTVQVRMIITKYGEIRSPFVKNSTDERLERYAIALIKHMPDWIPGQNKDQKICVDYILPIKFELQ